MKKPRFNLLAKITLFTGALTILTVATSFVVTTLVTYQNTKASYVDSCDLMTDNIESIFASNPSNALEILRMEIDEYKNIREEYDEASEQKIANYQRSLGLTLFGPKDGTFGMTQDKALRKGFYSEIINRMQFLCNTYKVPSSAFYLYDVGKKSVINVADSNYSIDDNIDLIGLKNFEFSEEVMAFFDSSELNKTFFGNDTIDSFNCVEIDMEDTNYRCYVRGIYPLAEFNNTFSNQILTELIITFASAAFLVIIYALVTRFYLIRNVHHLIDSTDQFVSKMTNDEPLEIVDSRVATNDEIKDLSDKVEVMESSIIEYVDKIKKAKDKEQAFNAEVDIASRIQLESIPAPTYFHKNVELRAFIKPAKGVGGDFYDYFYIDQNHFAVVIADVSGKGIPASLFMMRSKESIRSACSTEESLAKAFYKVNNELCLNNKEGFFVTVFLGVLNLKTYEFEFISAGHERPYIKHNGECKRLEVESNFVLGLEEDFSYEQQKIKLKEGDSIILYTDGLNEAINSGKEEFGYERMKESFMKDTEIKNNIDTVIADLDAFIGEESQFDDITLLAFNIKKNVITYSYLNPSYNEIDDLTDKVNAYLDYLEPTLLSKIDVVIDEVMNNIISYGKTKANKTLAVSIEKYDGGATLIFVDNSHPFNPLLKEMRTVQENEEEGIVGGLGISIVKSISKGTEYAYSNNRNILIIKF